MTPSFGAPAFYLLDVVGRSTLLLLGFVPMFILMLILAFSFRIDASGNEVARVPMVALSDWLILLLIRLQRGLLLLLLVQRFSPWLLERWDIHLRWVLIF